MKQIAVADAALTGFRVAREQPKVVAIWAGLYLAVQILSTWAMIALGGDALTEMMAIGRNPNPDPAAVMALYAQVAPIYGMLMLIMIPFYTVSITAAYRVVLKPADSRFGYMRLSADEARQFVVILALGVLLLLAYFVAVIVTTMIAGGVGAGLAAAGLPAIVATMIAVLVAIPLFLAMWTPLAVRLSLAGPQTLAEGQIRLFDSWRLTKGRFWPMLGVYVISTLLAVVVTVLGFVIAAAAAAAFGGGMEGMQSIMAPDMSSVGAYFTPVTIIYFIVMSIISAMGLAITLTPPAMIYRDIVGPSSSDLADAFGD